MFNNIGFNELEFNRIMKIVAYFPGGFPLHEPNDFHLMYDTDIVPVEYIGAQHSYANNPWTPHSGFSAQQWLYTSDLDLLFAGNDGYVHEFGVGDTDDGEKIDAYYVTKAIDLGSQDRTKKVRWLDVDAEIEHGSILRIEYRVDYDQEWMPLAETDQGSGRYLFVGLPKTTFRKIALRFSNGYKGCTFRINSFALDMVVHGQQKEVI